MRVGLVLIIRAWYCRYRADCGAEEISDAEKSDIEGVDKDFCHALYPYISPAFNKTNQDIKL